ncbi:unnamed protein product [Pleuronectes platessa]|uniref:Uncharacterized protein n=1 Tax=Pleuronectes platessa TaxID=8262 RepID=A0A9N7USA4_PLEPL|nr:unnamed protein product [Pleuronectes platessa]
MFVYIHTHPTPASASLLSCSQPLGGWASRGGEWKEKGVVKERQEEELPPPFFSLCAHTPSGLHPSLLHYSWWYIRLGLMEEELGRGLPPAERSLPLKAAPCRCCSSCATAAGLPSSQCTEDNGLKPCTAIESEGRPHVNHSCSYYRAKREGEAKGAEVARPYHSVTDNYHRAMMSSTNGYARS